MASKPPILSYAPAPKRASVIKIILWTVAGIFFFVAILAPLPRTSFYFGHNPQWFFTTADGDVEYGTNDTRQWIFTANGGAVYGTFNGPHRIDRTVECAARLFVIGLVTWLASRLWSRRNGTPIGAQMPNASAIDIALLRTAYAAFNARDIDAALTTMRADVAWPMAFKGGFVCGHEQVRAYWTEQWSQINPHVVPVAFHQESDARILVDVHQVVQDLAGAVLADVHVGHRFTLANGLIQAMEVCPLPAVG